LRYIRTKIEEIEENLAGIRGEIVALEEEVSAIEEEILAEQRRLEDFPKDDDLRTIRQSIREAVSKRELEEMRRKEYERQYNLLQEEIVELRQACYIFERENELKCNLVLVAEAVGKMREYKDVLDDMGDIFKEILSENKRLGDKEQTLSITLKNLSSLKDELEELRTDIDVESRRILSLEERLQLADVEEVRAKIREKRSRQEVLLEEKDRLNTSTIRKGEQLSTTRAKQEESERREVFLEELSKTWQDLFDKEYLRYSEEGESVEALKDYAKSFEPSRAEKEAQKTNRLGSVVREHTNELSGYSPEIIESFTCDTETLEKLDTQGEFASEIEVLRSNSKRNLLTVLNEQNRRTDIFRVVSSLEITIEEQERYIRQEDRNLFEHILLDSTGRIIKGLINSAEKWTKKMNDVLQRQNNYRGLKLLIEWKPKTAEDEREVGTRELVELLRRPSETLTDHDFERIVNHFRLKIEQAKIDMEKDENVRSLHDVMKQILDYRRWFRFVIRYEKDNQASKELSNHVFNRFSGGEKAISMYLPLFTAIYSRYEDGSKNAPYLVVLDEAFAGVDERNIAELFKAMEDLGFDYVLNSQSLWGDYETVKDLMIYQLIRERGSDIVVSREYRWNGRERREEEKNYG
ncbi:MAG: SbcC/MukB-like Walker B domain-containing protein, partial [Filifactor alocis]|nr:SbcC/MukB-like Walker B domain-containing protein [Filifactor alocis]